MGRFVQFGTIFLWVFSSCFLLWLVACMAPTLNLDHQLPGGQDALRSFIAFSIIIIGGGFSYHVTTQLGALQPPTKELMGKWGRLAAGIGILIVMEIVLLTTIPAAIYMESVFGYGTAVILLFIHFALGVTGAVFGILSFGRNSQRFANEMKKLETVNSDQKL